MSLSGLASFTGPVAHQNALFEEGLDHLLHEEGIAFGELDDESLERGHFPVSPTSAVSISLALSLPNGKPELCVASLVVPLMLVLGPVVDEQ
jgi:hypothetical protein